MKRIAIALLGLVSASSYGVVTTQEARAELLGKLENRINRSVRVVDADQLDTIRNPFSGNRIHSKEEALVVQEIPEEELLGQLALLVEPTGAFAMGGEYFLLFKERRAKTGDRLPVTYNSKEYVLTIKRVFGNGYVLSLGDSEIQVKLK